jgi:hypothetical protein
MVAQPFDAFKEDRMSKYLKVTLLAALAVTLLAALPVVAFAKTTYRTSKPVLSETPSMGKDFSVSGAITPASTSKCRATVKIRLLMQMGSKYDVMDVYTAKLTKMPAGKKGTRYTRTLNIPMMGKHAVQVLQYRGGKLVSKSQIVSFDVQAAAMKITIDPNSRRDCPGEPAARRRLPRPAHGLRGKHRVPCVPRAREDELLPVDLSLRRTSRGHLRLEVQHDELPLRQPRRRVARGTA